MNGQQVGDPAKLADALVHSQASRSRRYASPPAPTRSPRSREVPNLLAADAYRDLSSSLALDSD